MKSKVYSKVFLKRFVTSYEILDKGTISLHKKGEYLILNTNTLFLENVNIIKEYIDNHYYFEKRNGINPSYDLNNLVIDML